MDGNGVERAVKRLAAEAAEAGTENCAVVGIRTRGVVLARRIAEEIRRSEGVHLPVGILDIALYRDDLLSGSCDAVFKGSEINFDVSGKNILLCDDVLYTGRTVRAALSALASMGRAESVRLYVLVDRGHRELPFCANGVGKNIPAAQGERVVVQFRETDGADRVCLVKDGERLS